MGTPTVTDLVGTATQSFERREGSAAPQTDLDGASPPPQKRAVARVVTHEEAASLLSAGACYLDVRCTSEFERGHVQGAFNVPLAFGTLAGLQPNEHFRSVAQRVFSKDTPLVVGCHSGGRAAQAANELEALGFRQLVVHKDGWGGSRGPFGERTPGWSEAGRPTSTTPLLGRSYAELAHLAGLEDAAAPGASRETS